MINSKLLQLSSPQRRGKKTEFQNLHIWPSLLMTISLLVYSGKGVTWPFAIGTWGLSLTTVICMSDKDLVNFLSHSNGQLCCICSCNQLQWVRDFFYHLLKSADHHDLVIHLMLHQTHTHTHTHTHTLLILTHIHTDMLAPICIIALKYMHPGTEELIVSQSIVLFVFSV